MATKWSLPADCERRERRDPKNEESYDEFFRGVEPEAGGDHFVAIRDGCARQAGLKTRLYEDGSGANASP